MKKKKMTKEEEMKMLLEKKNDGTLSKYGEWILSGGYEKLNGRINDMRAVMR